MPRKAPAPTPPSTAEEMELERLEHIVLDGQQALNARNQLVLTMLNNGTRHADLTRRLNRVRAMRGAKNLTPHAVFALQRRLDSPRVSD